MTQEVAEIDGGDSVNTETEDDVNGEVSFAQECGAEGCKPKEEEDDNDDDGEKAGEDMEEETDDKKEEKGDDEEGDEDDKKEDK